MHDLSLTICRKPVRIYIAKASVHIPFDVIDRVIIQKIKQNAVKILHHFTSGHIQYKLISTHNRISSRNRKCPVRMSTIEV